MTWVLPIYRRPAPCMAQCHPSSDTQLSCGLQFMGIVEEVGPKVKGLKRGDRVVSSFEMGCGRCFYCNHQLYSGCAGTNPSELQASMYGQATAGFHGAHSTLPQPLVRRWRMC